MWQRTILFGWLLALALLHSSSAQEEAEKPKREKFGSSLERLRWDPRKEAAVETTEQKKKGKSAPKQTEDVIRIETTLAVFDVLVVNKQGRYVNGLSKDDF